MRAVLAILLCLASLPATAASPDAWAEHDAEVAKSCVEASGLVGAKTLPPVDFEGHSVTRVAGRIASGAMKGTRETMLCLFDKTTRKASVSAAPADSW